jgi:hypothetical protein
VAGFPIGLLFYKMGDHSRTTSKSDHEDQIELIESGQQCLKYSKYYTSVKSNKINSTYSDSRYKGVSQI